jgi:HSP20 family protein
VKTEDIDVSVADGVLTIKAESHDESETETKGFYRRERRFGSFQRQFTLPADVNADAANASYEDGVLTLTLPKAETAKPKAIKVEAAKPAIEAAAQ